MRNHNFRCVECGQHKTYESDFTTGYGVNRHDFAVCYECCGKNEERDMRETGRATLYLVKDDSGENFITNWPASLKIKAGNVRKSFHNIARWRYDVWFRFRGEDWHGIQYGDMTQIVHCRRIKSAA